MSEQDSNKQPSAPPPEASPSSLRMIVSMGGIGLLAGILIVATFQATFPRIERNKAAALQAAIFEVVPGARTRATFAVRGENLELLPEGEDAVTKYYACYDSAGALVGIALEASGQGFQDILRIIYGYSPKCGCVVGMKVLESKETPGLGDKIMKDPDFIANFEALDTKLGDDGDSMVHPIELAKKGEKTDAWQVEAITGATISSRAIADILRVSTSEAVPVIARNMDALEGGAQ
jgi:electron transport complex protein RnfG